jgi:hypothetical protein
MFSRLFRKTKTNHGLLHLTEPTASEWVVKSCRVEGIEFEKGPESVSCFYLPFTVEVGRVSHPKTYSYTSTLCSPAGWVEHMRKNGIEYMQGGNMLMLSRYDAKLTLRALRENVNSLAYLLGRDRNDEAKVTPDGPEADWVIRGYDFYHIGADPGPEDPEKFCDVFMVDVGAADEQGVMTFEETVGTPAGFLGEAEYKFTGRTIFVPCYNLEVLLKMVRENMVQLGSLMRDVS